MPPYRSASGLVMAITLLMVIRALLSGIGIWSGWQQVGLLESIQAGREVDARTIDASDSRQMVIGIAQMAENLILAIVFLVWVNRANKNARALGAAGMEFTSGWAVGWFFVPIANLWKPYYVVREIWQASHPEFRENWKAAPTSPLLGLWWAAWIIGNVVGQIAFRVSLRAETLPALLGASWLQIASDVLDFPLVLLALGVVRGIHNLQEEKHAQVSADQLRDAPPTVEPWDSQ